MQQFRNLVEFVEERARQAEFFPEVAALAKSFCWCIWMTRNNWVFKKQQWPIDVLSRKAVLGWSEFSLANSMRDQTSA